MLLTVLNLMLLYSGGLRLGEVINLVIEDLKIERQ
jgi:site-specific recombinase XerD